MRWFFVLMIMALAACQSTKSEGDYSAKPKECDQRQIEVGYCVPGAYEDSY